MQFTSSLNENRRFRALYAKGKQASGRFLTVYAQRPRRAKGNRLGITVSSKLGGAVVRNRVRRRLREAYRINESRLAPGFDLVVVARRSALGAEFAALERDLLEQLGRLGAVQVERGG